MTASIGLTKPLCDRLNSCFRVQARSCSEVLSSSAGPFLDLVRGAAAILIEWTADAGSLVPLIRRAEPSSNQGIPVIAVCQLGEMEQVDALLTGVDAALVWPFRPALLSAYLHAFNRRLRKFCAAEAIVTSGDVPAGEAYIGGDGEAGYQETISAEAAGVPHDVLRSGVMELDRTARVFSIRGRQVDLTTLEFEMADLFMSHPGICFRRERLLEQIWSMDFDTSTNLVDVGVCRLRRKFARFGLGKVIQTIRGAGYRFDPPL